MLIYILSKIHLLLTKYSKIRTRNSSSAKAMKQINIFDARPAGNRFNTCLYNDI